MGSPRATVQAAFMSRMLTGRLCFCLVDHCIVACPCFPKLLFGACTVLPDRRRAGSKSFGVHDYCLVRCSFLRYRGRFPWWGGFRTPRYHGPPGRLPKSAGRPMGPATLQCDVLRDLLGWYLSLCSVVLVCFWLCCSGFCLWNWYDVCFGAL